MMGHALKITYGVLPPSDNHIRDIGYIFTGKKKHAVIRYTREAEDYKKGLIRHINDTYFIEVQRFAREHHPESLYLLTVLLHFPAADILSAGWLSRTQSGERKAKNPYKRLDVMNRRKLIEDCLAEAIGIDDSLFWEGLNVKLVSQDDVARVDLLLEEVDPAAYGVPAGYLRGLHE